MKASLAAAIGILLLLLAVFLFLFSSVIAASDAQGAILFLFTLPLMLALLSLAALLTRSRSRPVFYLNVFATIFLLLFISAAIFPGLRFIGEATIGGISRIYKNLFGLSPYQAHHGAKLDLPTLFEKSIEAQGGDLLDLRKMEIFSSWNRVCLFDSRTDDQRAVEIGGVPKDWALSRYSKAGTTDSFHAMVFIGNGYPIAVADLNKIKVNFSLVALGRCFPKEKAVFQKGKAGLFEPMSQPSSAPKPPALPPGS